MGEHEGEGGVVADRADVAEMIGEPLELGHHAAQGVRPRRRLGAERGLDGAGEGDGVGDGGVAADPSRELGGALEARAAHQRVDALVGVAEPLLEPHDRLAAGVEAEMARLDDPGVDRADRNLMQARSLGFEEGVGVGRAVVGCAVPERMAQRPAAVIEPAAAVRRAEREEAVEVAGRPLEPAGRRMQRREGGKGAAVAEACRRRRASPSASRTAEPHPALVAPQADERRLAGGHAAAGLEPFGFAGEEAGGGHGRSPDIAFPSLAREEPAPGRRPGGGA